MAGGREERGMEAGTVKTIFPHPPIFFSHRMHTPEISHSAFGAQGSGLTPSPKNTISEPIVC